MINIEDLISTTNAIHSKIIDNTDTPGVDIYSEPWIASLCMSLSSKNTPFYIDASELNSFTELYIHITKLILKEHIKPEILKSMEIELPIQYPNLKFYVEQIISHIEIKNSEGGMEGLINNTPTSEFSLLLEKFEGPTMRGDFDLICTKLPDNELCHPEEFSEVALLRCISEILERAIPCSDLISNEVKLELLRANKNLRDETMQKATNEWIFFKDLFDTSRLMKK